VLRVVAPLGVVCCWADSLVFWRSSVIDIQGSGEEICRLHKGFRNSLWLGGTGDYSIVPQMWMGMHSNGEKGSEGGTSKETHSEG
jgi:hypothetical protein